MNPSNRSSDRSFGRREAAASASPTAPSPSRKRSAFIAIGALGVGAMSLMAISNQNTCDNTNAAQDPSKPQPKCDSRSSGRHWFSSGGGGSTNTSTGTNTKTSAATPTVERGGFGRTASSFFSRVGG